MGPPFATVVLRSRAFGERCWSRECGLWSAVASDTMAAWRCIGQRNLLGAGSHAPADPLRAIHEQVESAAAELAALHSTRLRCAPGCSDCCVDGIEVFEVEAERIRQEFPEVLGERPAPRGRCAFLDAAGRCRVYDARPYVCRTQGLPLRWFGEGPGGAIAEYRDICPLNEDGPALVELPDDACWLLGPVEGQLAAAQSTTGHPGARIALRALFERASD